MADREKVIRELKAARLFFEMGSNRADGVVGNLGCKSGMKYIDDALALLKEQEPVVRCKGCVRRGTYDCPIYVGGDGDHGSPDDWFCAGGERKTNDA